MKVTPFASEAAAGGVEDVRGEHTPERYAATQWFRIYEPSVIPGPLQSPAYAEAIADFWAGHLRPDMGEGNRAASVAARAAERAGLSRIALSRTFQVVTEEAVLRTAVGGAGVLEGALRHLLELMRDTPGLSVAVIPSGAAHGRDVPPTGPFWLLDSALVVTETASAALAMDDPASVTAHGDLFRRLHGIAVTGYQARRLIMDAREQASRGE